LPAMKPKIVRGLGQAFLILVLSLLLGTVFNQFGPQGISWTAPQVDPALAGLAEISAEEARVLFERGKAVFLDARDSSSFREGHIAGALNITSETAAFNIEMLRSLSDSGMVLIAYCDTPGCSLGSELARSLTRLGVSNIKVLEKGLSFWSAQNYPIGR
jgi:rhodanese-related sulfurtransferase